MVIYIAVLIHAPSLWYYLIGGLALWMLDRVIRFKRGCRPVEVLVVESKTNEATRLELQFKGKHGFKYLPGQFCFLNIPVISATQWHPFSITSSPMDSSHTVEFNIKSMGEGTFTGDLAGIAAQQNKERLTVSVDGPYGHPIDYDRYTRIVFMAGGIGITPAHSLYRYLYQRDENSETPKQLHLIWIFQTMESFEAVPCVERTLKEVHESQGNHMGMRAASPVTFALRAPRHSLEFGGPTEYTTRTGLPVTAMKSSQIDYRSEIETSVLSGEPLPPTDATQSRTLVFACGPRGLVERTQEASIRLGYDFHAETFEL